MNRDTMKTTFVGVLGTATTLTVKQYSDVMAAIAGTLTVAYMLIKLGLLIYELRKKSGGKHRK